MAGDTGMYRVRKRFRTENGADKGLNDKVVEKPRIVVQNQHLTEMAILGKVAASAGFTTVAKLKSALELTNVCLANWKFDIDGEKPRVQCNPLPEWPRPKGIQDTIKKGWELGVKLDAVISAHMKTLRADGLGKCFSPME